jgi:rhodanese-related sulfurtransferase
MREVSVHEFASARADGAFAIDVRQPFEYVAGHAPGVASMPEGEVVDRTHHLPKGETIYVVCRSGNRSAFVADALTRRGFDAVNVAGGTAAWEAAGYPVVRGTVLNVA